MNNLKNHRILVLTDFNGKIISRQNFLAGDSFESRHAAEQCFYAAARCASVELKLNALMFTCLRSFSDEHNERRLGLFLSDILERENPDAVANFDVSANGTSFGVFTALNEQVARDLCAREAGYKDEIDMAAKLGRPSELIATKI